MYHWLLTIFAVLIAFGYSFYIRTILAGNADLTEKSMMAGLVSWMEENGAKSKRKVWIAYWGSLLFEIAYLYLSFATIENMTFHILTGAAAGVEAYAMSRMHQRIWNFFHGKISLGEVFSWKIERISAMVMFTHAIIVLLVPMLSWF